MPSSSGPLSESLTIPFELEALASARRYQAWIGDTIRPWLGQRVLEIGAGLGNLSEQLPVRERLILTEPDAHVLGHLKQRVKTWGHPDSVVSVERFDPAADSFDRFRDEGLDTVVSFNVLEHIEQDREAVSRLCDLLRASPARGPKRLVSMVPAHSWAYGSLDRSFRHFRRYSYEDMRSIASQVAPEARFTGRYFNSVGLLGWVVTGQILKRPKIGAGGVRLFEALCPLIRPVDTLLQTLSPVPLFGQSLLAVIEL